MEWLKCHSAIAYSGYLAQFWAVAAGIPVGSSQCGLETSACQFTVPGSLFLEGEVGRKEELNCVTVNSAVLFGHRAEPVPIYSAQ